MKKLVITIMVLCFLTVGLLSGCIESPDPLTATEVYNNDLAGEYQQGDIVWVTGTITGTAVVGGAGRAMLDDILEIKFSMGQQGDIIGQEEKTFLGHIQRQALLNWGIEDYQIT